MILNDPLLTLPAPATSRNVCRSPGSGSAADRPPTIVPTGRFSATRAGVSEIPVGGSFCTTTSQLAPTRSDMSAMARSPAPSPQDTTSTNPAPSRAFSTSRPRPPLSRSLPGQAGHLVVAARAEQPVRPPRPDQGVVAIPAADILDVGGDVVAFTPGAVVRPRSRSTTATPPPAACT